MRGETDAIEFRPIINAGLRPSSTLAEILGKVRKPLLKNHRSAQEIETLLFSFSRSNQLLDFRYNVVRTVVGVGKDNGSEPRIQEHIQVG